MAGKYEKGTGVRRRRLASPAITKIRESKGKGGRIPYFSWAGRKD
jgi:hypothetical protein